MKELIFVGLNGRVSAIDRGSGKIIWLWHCPKPSRGFVSLFLDGDRLFAGINGYLYCLEAVTGRPVWENPMRGYGYGIFSFASVRGNQNPAGAAQQIAYDEAANAAAVGGASAAAAGGAAAG